MKHPPKCSLIITAYNQGIQLKLVLQSAALQSDLRFEIIIADDGSSDSTVSVIQTFREKHRDIPVHHVFHEDDGFRKNHYFEFRRQKSKYRLPDIY